MVVVVAVAVVVVEDKDMLMARMLVAIVELRW